ncbi:hypothetical protein [Streptomyces asiaticus]|uniref:hypothetical protein n=1 Tax=Streptomyces asiaticus TaxID=114695 RepID=UPI001BA79346|nr:hypothetical protein [Streptomyces asiaticus]
MTLIDEITVAGLPAADVVQYELADVDERFHTLFGRDETAWLPAQVTAYNAAINAVWAGHGERAA